MNVWSAGALDLSTFPDCEARHVRMRRQWHFLATDRADLRLHPRTKEWLVLTGVSGTTPTTRGPGRPLRGLFGGKARLCRHSDWAGERPEMKSTSGGWLMCGTSLLRSWSSTQNTIALSAAEAELCATSKRARHALHLKSMGEDFGVVVEPLIRRNASAALGIACRRGLAGKTRHVQVQYMWANEHVQLQKVLGSDKRSRSPPAKIVSKQS